MFTAVLIIAAKSGNNPKCLSTDKWVNTTGVSKQRNILSDKNHWRSDILYNMDELWKHYANWKKLVIKTKPETHIWYDFIHLNVQNRQIYRQKVD